MLDFEGTKFLNMESVTDIYEASQYLNKGLSHSSIVTVQKNGSNGIIWIPMRTKEKMTENVWTYQQHIHNRNLQKENNTAGWSL